MGIWILLATTSGHQRKDFWKNGKVDCRFGGAPFTVNDLMSAQRFEFITRTLKYFTEDMLPYQDKFHPICELQDAFNENMKAVFIPSYMVCLDESMPKWLSQ